MAKLTAAEMIEAIKEMSVLELISIEKIALADKLIQFIFLN